MILVQNILGNISSFNAEAKCIDEVNIEWYEVNKRILKKISSKGLEVGIKFEKPRKLNEGDILFIDEKSVLVVSILPCEVISIVPAHMHDMGRICYEIGNKHIPLFFNEAEILVCYDEPLMKLLEKQGFKPKKAVGKLINGVGSGDHTHDHHHSHLHTHEY